MSKEESFEEYWSEYGSGIDSIKFCCLHAWNHQQKKLDKANEELARWERVRSTGAGKLIEKLESENKQLKEALKLAVEVIKDLINKTEYGVNQWQEAWAPNEETESQKSIKRARQFLESDQWQKVKGELENES